MQARVGLAWLLVPAAAWGQMEPTVPLRIRKPASMPAPVKEMPYSGEWQSERREVRADGTRITETGVPRKDYRDSQGRIRRERTLPRDNKDGVRIVTIDDPAAGTEYVLEPGKKIAHRFVLEPAKAGQAVPPPELSTKTEVLNPEVIRGLRAEGVRRTIAIPAVGGQAARETVVETWTAADLEIVLREHTNDPLLGEIDTHVTELHAGEPPPGLFQVPPDYQRVDERGDFTISTPMRSPASAPEVISRVAAKYTDEARRAGVQGIVLLSATIDRTGRARDVQVERGLDPGLDQEAIKAVQQWRFKPAEQDGHPVRVSVHVEVTFGLLN
jgi:TonB family protein